MDKDFNTSFKDMYVLYPPQWVMIPMHAIILVFILGGNVLVVVSVATNRALRKVSNYFLVSLALVDILVGVVSTPGMFGLEEAFRTRPMCMLYFSVDLSVTAVSVLHILAVTVDRYVAITRPLRYPTVVTPKRVLVTIVWLWIVGPAACIALIFSGLVTFDQCSPKHTKTAALIEFLGLFCLPFLAAVVIYGHIYRLTIRHQEFMERMAGGGQPSKELEPVDQGNTGANGKLEPPMNILPSSGSCCSVGASSVATTSSQSLNSSPETRKSDTRKGRKALKMIACILLGFILGWGMFYAMILIEAFSADGVRQSGVFSISLLISIILLEISLAVNPVIYAFLNEDYKYSFRRLLKCRR